MPHYTTFLFHFLSLQPIFNTMLTSPKLYTTMQQPERLSDTHPSCHADLDLLGKYSSGNSHSSLHNSLRISEVDSYFLNNTAASFHSRPELMSLSLIVFLFLLKAHTGLQSVRKLLGIIYSPDLTPAFSATRLPTWSAIEMLLIVVSKSTRSPNLYIAYQGSIIMSSLSL